MYTERIVERSVYQYRTKSLFVYLLLTLDATIINEIAADITTRQCQRKGLDIKV